MRVLAPVDWVIVGAYLLASFSIAVYFHRRASRSTTEFFLSGRSMPWWLAGTSMVATTFAADTPLAVTELVAADGIAGNWLWWNFAFGSVLTVFFFAPLWRRSGVLTDVEFVELRYDGPAAPWLRGIKAVFFGLVLNCVIIGWVALAMETVIRILMPGLTLFGRSSFHLLGLPVSASLVIVAALVLLVALYTLLSGLWGVVVTDAFQFTVAMGGSVVLAVYVLDLPEVGGMPGLMRQLPPQTFRILPTIGEAAEGAAVLSLSVAAFVAYMGVQWWASWYPGNEPGGGGYVAQRMLSARDERHALLATLWFVVAHYCLRPWPWIVVALAAVVLYPDVEHPREGFVMAMRDVLPPGVLGLVAAAFLAAFMSTVSTQLNWGTSYLVNDLWRRFIRPDATERHYVRVSRVITFALGLCAVVVTANLGSISEAWGLVITASAGLGLVLILRWYWWRVSAWSELAATLSPMALMSLALALRAFDVALPGLTAPFPGNLFAVTAFTTIVWVAATFLTRPTGDQTLDAFYRRVRPAGPGWTRFARRHPDLRPGATIASMALNWLAGVVLVYSALFGAGYALMRHAGLALLWTAIAAVSAVFVARRLARGEQGAPA